MMDSEFAPHYSEFAPQSDDCKKSGGDFESDDCESLLNALSATVAVKWWGEVVRPQDCKFISNFNIWIDY